MSEVRPRHQYPMLTSLIYRLVRDEISFGVLETHLVETDKASAGISFSREHIARYAEEVVRRITGIPIEDAIRPVEQPVRSLDEIVRIAVRSAIERNNGNKSAAARELGITFNTLRRKMRGE